MRLLLALTAAIALLAPATPVHAATFTFSNARTTSAFNNAIDFSIDLDASEAPSRVELWVTYPGAPGPAVAQIQSRPGTGTSHLHYTLHTSGADHLMPNTPLTAEWVAFTASGGEAHSDASTFRYSDDTQHWQTLRDGIVTVHWTQGSTSFAQRAADIAVKAISTNATLLGVDESKPVDFFIYGDDASFRAALGPAARENVGGEAVTEIRTLFAELTPDMLNDAWVGIVITHELTHQVIDDATSNPYRGLPRWLNEGVAVYQSEGNPSRDRGMVQDAISSGDLLPLTALGWQFPTDPQKTSLAYAEAVSAVDYLVKTYGKDALVKLVLAYKNGPTDDEALTSAVGVDLATFQSGWYASIGATAPSQFGPQANPSGPLPSGWSEPSASQAPSGSPVPAASPSASGEAAATVAAPTATPGATIAAAPASSQDGGGGDLALVLGALVVIAAVVLIGIVVAGRRAASP